MAFEEIVDASEIGDSSSDADGVAADADAVDLDPGLAAGPIIKDALDLQIDGEAGNAVGLKMWEMPPKRSSAKCFGCNANTVAGEVRFEYRFKQSTSLRDQKRLHSRCVRSMPVATRARDVRVLQRWLADPTLVDEVVRTVLRDSLALLT